MVLGLDRQSSSSLDSRARPQIGVNHAHRTASGGYLNAYKWMNVVNN
jgi:hypothetical protein